MSARIPTRLRSAFTLVEMLIAMALTLILVYAIAEFYAYVGTTVRDGRAMIELNGQMRIATTRLAADLELLTVKVVPWTDDGNASGYFEYREGPATDADPEGDGMDADSDGSADIAQDANSDGVPDFVATYGASNTLGDNDDYLAFTIRSAGEPFVGQTIGIDLSQGTMLLDAAGDPLTSTIPSNTAEVAWWTTFTDATGDFDYDVGEPRFLQRRQIIVRPDLNAVHPGDTNYAGPYFVRLSGTNAAELYYTLLQYCDVSIRPLGVINGYTYFFANSLIDLTRRENRFMHVVGPANFPNAVDLNPNYYGDTSQDRSLSPVNDGSQWRWVLDGNRAGEERILSSLLAFDVRVFDPQAVIRQDDPDLADSLTALEPGDPGYLTAIQASPPYSVLGLGCYVDLGYGHGLHANLVAGGMTAANATTLLSNTLGSSQFASQTAYLSQLGRTYDTWALSYERDVLNQDYLADSVANINTAPFDEGTNGLDDDGINGVDDPGERETSPPYPTRLRGIQVKIRMYEPGTRQVRQATVGTDFLQE